MCTFAAKNRFNYAAKIEGDTQGAGHDEQGVRRASVEETAVHEQHCARQNKRVDTDARENGECARRSNIGDVCLKMI